MDISTATIAGQVIHDGQVVGAFNQFLISLLTLASTAVATLGGLYIKSKLNSANTTWEEKLAYRLVCYAEQKLTDAGNQGKFNYVTSELQDHFGMDPKESAHIIEAAIVQLRSTQAAVPVTETPPVPAA